VIAPLSPYVLTTPPEIVRVQIPNAAPPVKITPPREGEIVPIRKEIEEPPPEVLTPPEGETRATPEGTDGRGVIVPPPPGPTGGEVYPGLHDTVYVEELPEPVKTVKPDYPEMPKLAQVEGTVVVHVLVAKNGRVRDAVVDPKFSIPMLDAAAVEAARAWVFKPAFANNRPVAVWVAIPFHFVLH
jgi:TonB family protein